MKNWARVYSNWTNMCIPYGSAVSLLGIYPTERSARAHPETGLGIFTGAQFVILSN